MKSANANLSREARLIGLIKEITRESLIGDDCAVLPAGGADTLISSDMLVEGKHFLLPQMNFADLGWKSIAVNLSDIAAMAGIPDYVVVNIAMPAGLSDKDFSELYSAMAECAAAHNTRIVGGDLTASDRLVISVTVLGRPGAAGALMRSGAKPGHSVIVSGDFGASALGLALILNGAVAESGGGYALKRHLRPEPRLKEAQAIVEHIGGDPAALMDASDGLADALLQIAEASGVGLRIEAENIPIHAATFKGAERLEKDSLDLALYGGEDYELVAAVSPECWAALSAQDLFVKIGEVVSESGVIVKTKTGEISLDRQKTFQHWS